MSEPAQGVPQAPHCSQSSLPAPHCPLGRGANRGHGGGRADRTFTRLMQLFLGYYSLTVKGPFADSQVREIPERGPQSTFPVLEGIHPESSRIQLHSHVGPSTEFTFPTIIPNPGSLASPHCLRAVPSCLHTAHTDNSGVQIKNESAENISFKSSSMYTQHLLFSGHTSPFQTIHHHQSPITQMQQEAQQPLCPANTLAEEGQKLQIPAGVAGESKMVSSAAAAPEAHIFIYHLQTSIQNVSGVWGHSFCSQLRTGPDLLKEVSNCVAYLGMHVSDPIRQLCEPPRVLC